MPITEMLYPAIMASSQIVTAQGERFIEEEAKLYAAVADNAGIGSPPLPVFPAEIVNYTGLEFLLQVNLMVGNVQNTTDMLSLMCLIVVIGRIPEAHMYANYFMGSLFEQ